MTKEEEIALEMYNRGKKYDHSIFIDEDTIIAGYGKLHYDFEFPLPNFIVMKEFGTTSWEEWFKIKELK